MKVQPRVLALVMLLPLASACAATDGEYPSLAIRDVERVAGTLEAPVSPLATTPPPATAAELNVVEPYLEAAAAAYRAFLELAPATRAAVGAARNAGVGSESWARAQVSLAGLVSARSSTMVPLADLDRIYVTRAAENESLVAVERVRAAVVEMVEQEDAAIAELQRIFGR